MHAATLIAIPTTTIKFTTQVGYICACGNELTIQLYFLDHPLFSSSSSYVNSDQMFRGWVKETVRFIITDDLNILPISTITSIILLNQLHVERPERNGGNDGNGRS